VERKKRQRIRIALACGILTVLGILSFVIRTPYLTLTHAQTNARLYHTAFGEGETFSIRHIHSLHLSPVTEIYEIRGGQIMLIALEFETFGAGLPEGIEPGQTLTRLETGGLRIDGIDRLIPDLRILIGHTAEHTLHIRGQRVPLDTLDDSGQSVRFALRALNIWQRLYFKR